MSEPSTPLVNNQVYTVIKALAQLILPAVGALYFALAGVWGLPDAEKVVGTITAVDVFLGVVLVVLARSYANSDAPYDGDMVVGQGPNGNPQANLVLNDDAANLIDKTQVVFKVKKKLSPALEDLPDNELDEH